MLRDAVIPADAVIFDFTLSYVDVAALDTQERTDGADQALEGPCC